MYLIGIFFSQNEYYTDLQGIMKINNEWTWCMYILEPREWWSLWWRKDSVSSSSTVSARRSYTASVVQSHWINITEVESILSKLIRATLARHRTWWADELAQSWVEFTHNQSMKLWKAVAATLKKGATGRVTADRWGLWDSLTSPSSHHH